MQLRRLLHSTARELPAAPMRCPPGAAPPTWMWYRMPIHSSSSWRQAGSSAAGSASASAALRVQWRRRAERVCAWQRAPPGTAAAQGQSPAVLRGDDRQAGGLAPHRYLLQKAAFAPPVLPQATHLYCCR